MMTRRDALITLSLATAAVATRPLAGFAAAGASAPFELLPLPYPADALEPHIDAQTMALHHGKHHAGYVNNLNAALAGFPDLQGMPVDKLITDLGAVPESIRTTVRNNGGGHANHALFWNCLSPAGGGDPQGDLAAAVDAQLGGAAALRDALTKAALGVFGSGWAWLSLRPDGTLLVEQSANQDSPLMEGRQPLLGIDVWEHAYYLKHQNRRADYLAAIWNVLDWGYISNRYEELRG